MGVGWGYGLVERGEMSCLDVGKFLMFVPDLVLDSTG